MQTALVTGAHGLVGSRLVKRLHDRGVRVVVLRRDRSRPSALELEGTEARCAVVRGDLRDAAALERAVAGHACDTVFHLAAQAVADAADGARAATFEVNVRGTWTLLEACRRHDVRRVVVAGSAKAYGPGAPTPRREDDALGARGTYEVSKACADLVARSFSHAHGTPVAVARCANTYGGGDLNPSRLVPGLLAALTAGEAPVVRSDGSPERDFLHVEDAVEAYLAIAGALDADGAAGEAFNVGGPRPRAVREVVSALVAATGSTARVAWAPTTGAPDTLLVDSAKLRERTGWAPRVELEEGLRRTVAWHAAHPHALTPVAA